MRQPDIPGGHEAGARTSDPAHPVTGPAAYPPAGSPGYPEPDGYPAAGRGYYPSATQAGYSPAGLDGYPAGGTARPGRRQARSRRRVAAGVLITGAALVALAASLIGLTTQVLPRRFTATQQREIMAWEVAGRWRAWPASKIFPSTAGYRLSAELLESASGLGLTARRVGIAAQSSCAAGTDPPLALVLRARGCIRLLRASYADATGSFVVTVGVAVLDNDARLPRRLPRDHGLAPGVRPAAFPGTLAARFADRQRQLAGSVGYGPYLVLYTVGYTDGRRRDRASSDPYADSEMRDLGIGVARDIGSALGARPPVPRCPGAPGC